MAILYNALWFIVLFYSSTVVEMTAHSNRSKARGNFKFLDCFSYLRTLKKKGKNIRLNS